MRAKATVAAFDMAAVIHMVKPGSKTHTFKDYAHKDLKPYLMRQLGDSIKRVDYVFESYSQGDNSLKVGMRMKRGGNFSQRTHVGPNIPIPKGKCWQDFLKVTENKK